MRRVVHKAKNSSEAEKWDILQQIMMTPAKRMKIARELRIRFYGKDAPDVRDREK